MHYQIQISLMDWLCWQMLVIEIWIRLDFVGSKGCVEHDVERMLWFHSKQQATNRTSFTNEITCTKMWKYETPVIMCSKYIKYGVNESNIASICSNMPNMVRKTWSQVYKHIYGARERFGWTKPEQHWFQY